MSLKVRFLVLSLVFVAGTVAFYFVLEGQKNELRSIRHRIEDDWEETRQLMQLAGNISRIHLEFHKNGLQANRQEALEQLAQARVHASEVRDHAENDITGEEAEENELAALRELEKGFDEWEAFLRQAPPHGGDVNELLREMNRLYGMSMNSVSSYSHGALQELDISLDRLDRSEEVLDEMSETWTLGMFVLLGLAWLGFGFWMLRPIRKLQKMVRRVRDGRFDSLPTVDAPGEIGEVISSFQKMAAEISSFTSELEQRVEQRTEELEASRLQLRQMLDRLPDAVGLATSEGKLVMANERYRTLLTSDGLSRLSEIQQSEKTPQGYRQWTGQDGKTHVLDVQEFPIATSVGDPEVILEYVRDMTLQVGVEAALASSQKLAAIGRLSSGMAHEINNPLTAIGACAEGLLKRLKSGQMEAETFQDYLQTIHDEVYRSKEITERLLDLSRRREQELARFHPSEVIYGIVRLVGKLAEAKDIQFRMNVDEGIEIHSSPSAVRQVLLNLIMNSIEACDRGGVVRITAAPENDAVGIVIEDDGAGIAPDDLGHLFEPFFTRRRDQSGTGLGLYVCQGLVDALGGRILAESEGLGKGSRFIVLLPCRLRSRAGTLEDKEANKNG